MKLLRCLVVASLGITISGCATLGNEPSCDRACLVALAETYFDALGTRAPDKAAFADGALLTENGVAVTRMARIRSSRRRP